MTLYERLRGLFDQSDTPEPAPEPPEKALAVTPVQVGLKNDGVTRIIAGGSAGPTDRPWASLMSDGREALEAWRRNPMARRFINLVTAYVVGDGITLSTENRAFANFIQEFFDHPDNHMLLRERQWCDELTRSGELFVTMFTDPSGGVPVVRAVPAGQIAEVKYREDGEYVDYEAELAYKQIRAEVDAYEGVWWFHPRALTGQEKVELPRGRDPLTMPVMLHYAINRPVGAIRGESDLAPILLWLRRYAVWLEDRVRLNAAMRAFVWVVHVQAAQKEETEARLFANPPQSGSVIVLEEGSERWEAITPNLHAQDAKEDGRALRWMIAAGGHGMSLLDFGEGEDSNLATGEAMRDQRQRFLRQRQAYFGEMLAEVTLIAYERWRGVVGGRHRAALRADLSVELPDIAAEDNSTLATAAGGITAAFTALAGLVGASREMRFEAVRLFAKFAGEGLSESVIEQWVTEGDKDLEERKAIEAERFAAKGVGASKGGSSGD
jgi:hypothetical protein